MTKSTGIDYNDPKYLDPMEEIYAIRRELSEECGHDIYRLMDAARAWQRKAESEGLNLNFVQLPIVCRKPAMA